jgi:hypothetical protein
MHSSVPGMEKSPIHGGFNPLRGDLGGLNFTIVFPSKMLTRDYDTEIHITFS